MKNSISHVIKRKLWVLAMWKDMFVNYINTD